MSGRFELLAPEKPRILNRTPWLIAIAAWIMRGGAALVGLITTE
jgi:hypothetical protein